MDVDVDDEDDNTDVAAYFEVRVSNTFTNRDTSSPVSPGTHLLHSYYDMQPVLFVTLQQDATNSL